MIRPRWARICIGMALAIGLATGANAANDTAKFNGQWKASFPFNGQTVTMVSIHQGSEYKNYVLVPNGAMFSNSGTFSAIDGKWTATADKPNDSGTYHFTSSDSVTCTNATGQILIWRRNHTPLPTVVNPPQESAELEKYRKAADAGDVSAMNSAGVMYDNGQGVPRDLRQALYWYRKAAEGGNANGALQVGFFYGTGKGVPQDYGQAMYWYRKAADEGNAAAMRNIGILYSEGDGVPMDPGQAIFWCRKAAAAGDERSKEWLRANGLSESGTGNANGHGSGMTIRK